MLIFNAETESFFCTGFLTSVRISTISLNSFHFNAILGKFPFASAFSLSFFYVASWNTLVAVKVFFRSFLKHIAHFPEVAFCYKHVF